MTRSQKLQLNMQEMAKRIAKKERKIMEKRALLVEIPTESDLAYWNENSKIFLG